MRTWRARSLLVVSFLLYAVLSTIVHALVGSTVLAAILLALAGIAAALALTRQIVNPLRQLRAEIPELARGRRNALLTEPRIEEQEQLADGIAGLIHELREVQAGLRGERESLRLLAESGSEGLLAINPTGHILYHNRAASELLGLGDARGRPVNALVREPRLRRWIAAVTAGAGDAPFEGDVDGRHLLITARHAANVTMLTVVDLTEVRRLESVRRDLIANVSHELKTPLTAIRGYAETLLQDEVPDQTRTQFLHVIHRNATRIQRIIDDLLDLSRLQSGGWQPALAATDAGALAHEIWTACSADARKNLEFDLRTRGTAAVLADPAGLRQVYANLFDNALRYTPEGGRVTVTIAPSASAYDERRLITIEVRDTGPGIPRDALSRIFERFYRVDAARSRTDGGTGLGLAIVKHLVERMDGAVSAESELGKGTAIRLTLPAA